MNWHIDANLEWKSISMMLEKGYIRKGIEYSFHITAGDFRDKPEIILALMLAIKVESM